MKFKDYVTQKLYESPQRMPDDAPFEEVFFDKITDISKRIIDLDYILVEKNFIEVKNNKLDLYKHKDAKYYVLGRFYQDTKEKQRFAVIFEILLYDNEISSKHKLLKNRNIERVESVHTSKNFRGNKIATKVYKEIMKDSVLMSNQIQYRGAVNLWKTFIDNPKILVYIYDILEDKIITKVTKNTDIKHIWSDDSSKRRIRLLATFKEIK